MDAPVPAFRDHDKLFHRFNPDLGPGRVEQVEGRRIVVYFPAADTRLTLAADDSALRPMPVRAGQKARLEGEEKDVLVDEVSADRARLADGRVVPSALLWPLAPPDDPVDRLGALQTDRAAAFRNRLDGLLLTEVRQARGLGSFLGGRISIFPHQLHVAERATASDPVRWLLADEVGLGKTIEACLILSRLLRTDRADRALVVAPSTLTVQWLGELYRKFHQTFVLLDRRRREDVAKEHGEGFNPFEAHRRAIVALEDLTGEPGLARKAETAGSTSSSWTRRTASSARAARREATRTSRSRRSRAPPGTFSSCRRRRSSPTRTRSSASSSCCAPTRTRARRTSSPRSGTRRRCRPARARPVASTSGGSSLAFRGPSTSTALRRARASRATTRPTRTTRASRGSPGRTPRGAREGQAKTIVFVHERATLSALKARLESATRKRVAIFHEELTPERGDVEVAEFRRADGPSILVSTEAGGEGRNFEFCRRLVLFDLPADPAAVEQRIGRLDRINRKMPVEIVYFRPPDGFGREIVTLFERIGLFTSPLGGLERSLSEVEARVARARRLGKPLPVEELAADVARAAEAREKAVYHHLHRDGFSPEKAPGILARVPADLDARTERFVLEAADLFGFETAERAGRRTWYLEFGADALVEHLPGVAGGSRWLGTFDRAEAVEKEELDFFASGHALVEGIFRELEDGPRGRVALLSLEKAGVSSAGVLFAFRRGASVELVAASLDGREQPAWADQIVARRAEVRGVRPEDWTSLLARASRAGRAPDWAGLVRRVAKKVLATRPDRRLEAVAAFRLSR